MNYLKRILVVLPISMCLNISTPLMAQDSTFVMPDQIAVFNPGNQSMYEYMQAHIKYPKKAKKEKLEGKVLVGFTVTKEGTLTDINIKNSSDPIFNESAIDLVKSMKKWQPAMKDGQPIDFKMALPINFHLKK